MIQHKAIRRPRARSAELLPTTGPSAQHRRGGPLEGLNHVCTRSSCRTFYSERMAR
jgi:hypothetical protein